MCSWTSIIGLHFEGGSRSFIPRFEMIIGTLEVDLDSQSKTEKLQAWKDSLQIGNHVLQ